MRNPTRYDQNLIRLRAWFPVAAVLLTTGVFAQASTINSILFNVGQSPAFFPDSPAAWNVSGAELTQGTILAPGHSAWLIAPFYPPGEFSWAADLDTDLNPAGPLAYGRFKSGGTITLSGEIWDANTFDLVYSGPLLQATVSAFELKETNATSNLMNNEGIITITPTGGYLVTNSELNMVGDYRMDVSVTNIHDMEHGSISNFQNFLVEDALQISFTAVPEPASLLLLSGAALLWMRPKRQR